MECIKEEYCYQNASDITFKRFSLLSLRRYNMYSIKVLPSTTDLLSYLQAQSLQLEMNTNTNNTFIIESKNHIIKMP